LGFFYHNLGKCMITHSFSLPFRVDWVKVRSEGKWMGGLLMACKIFDEG
jgi:hypothetical protein